MRAKNPLDKCEQRDRSTSPTNGTQNEPSVQVQPLLVPREFWSSVSNVSTVQGTSDRRSRSLSAPASQTGSQRICQRCVDKFCTTDPTRACNFTGLQPTEIYKRKSSHSNEEGGSCSRCPNRPSNGGYILSNNGLSYDSMRPQTSNPPEDRGFDLSYEKWLRQQKQQKLQQQQQQQQQLQQLQQGQSYNWPRNDQTYEKFEPTLNSTMNSSSRQPCSLSSCVHLRTQNQQQQQQPQPQPQPQQQQQQPQQKLPQQQQLQQLPQQQKQQHTCCQHADPNQSQAYAPGLIARRNQRDVAEAYDTTEYIQLPQAQPQRSNFVRTSVQQPTNVTFYDGNSLYSPTNRSQSCGPIRSDSWPSTSRGAFSPLQNSTPKHITSTTQAGPSCKSEQCNSRQVPFIDDTTPEQRYIQRTNALFFNALVMDQTCPGIIQNSLNGREDFNEYAFDIAFAGKIPDEPYPIDPITMIEAIQIRIDHEREEIRKKCPFYDTYRRRRSDLDTVSETSNDEGKKPKQKYYSSQKSQRGASSDKSKHVSSSQKGLPFSADYDNIDRHFCSKNISEVNNGVLAFLKAEQSYGSTPHAHDYSNFSADINSHESNFFGLPIKMKIYNGTTWPTD
ncbi:formin-J [Drosophila hydei]|uniref:Formin-J n=1 Tax=Drosophila hydei TaxID=7224 RepID=A0A6J2SUD9_DROHY|nr:formin-J [Drosophila hydei]